MNASHNAIQTRKMSVATWMRRFCRLGNPNKNARILSIILNRIALSLTTMHWHFTGIRRLCSQMYYELRILNRMLQLSGAVFDGNQQKWRIRDCQNCCTIEIKIHDRKSQGQ